MILHNLNWKAIQPFSSSLADYFGSQLSSVTNIKDVTENTWRKALNNLIYLYKTKGTKNAVRGLLNIYGYPPDIIKIKEFGQSNQFQYPDESIDTIQDDINLVYELPEERMEYDYNGKMYNLETNQINLLVTPNHRMYVSDRNQHREWPKCGENIGHPPKKSERAGRSVKGCFFTKTCFCMFLTWSCF